MGARLPCEIPQTEHVGGGNYPQRSLLAGPSKLWRRAAPPPPRASAQSRRLLSMRRPQSATRPPIEPCPRMGGGGPPLAPLSGSGARGAVSGRTPRACAPGSPPAAAEEARLRGDGGDREPLLADAEPALHRRVAVPGLQRPVVGSRRGEVPGVDIGCGVGRVQRCVSSVRQRMVCLCPLRDRAKRSHCGGP